MNENLNNENNNYVEPQNDNKGVKGLLITLIILMIAGLLLLGYKMFIYDKKGDNKVNDNNSVIENNKVVESDDNQYKEVNNNTDIQLKDTFALQVENSGSGIFLYYYTLKDGKVYELKKEIKSYEGGLFLYNTSLKNEYFSDAVNENVNLREIKGLPAIKRIKGMVSVATDVSQGILLVAENGEVYIYQISGSGYDGETVDLSRARFLDEYKVDDVISYYAVPGCTGGVGIKTCGGEYNIIDKEGNTHHYRVNQDGTLTKK